MLKMKDQLIVKVLEKNGKLSIRKLAAKVGLPISTVHRKVMKLEKEGIIKGYRAIIDYEKVGYPISVLIFLNISENTPGERYRDLGEIVEDLKKMPDVCEIMDLKGNEWDLLVKARLRKLKNTTELVENIRKMEGIEEISSTIIVDDIIL